MNVQIFRIKDRCFKIDSAVFKGHLDEKELRWSISIQASYPQGRIDNEEWLPRAYSENLLGLNSKKVDRWENIFETLEWDESYDDEKGVYNAALCVFSHNDIYKSIMRFKNIHKKSFYVEWTAKCDVFFGEEYDTNLDLEIRTEVEFAGIEVSEHDEKKARYLLGDYITSGQFDFQKSTDNFPSTLVPRA